MTMIILEYKGLKIYLKDEESLNTFLIKYGIGRDEVKIVYD
ncbi:hypothetical protein J5U23_01563 [Saccharolobus shibatae B12]|uniref:Uncharacterized protein n=1 Tax=Saccharolobus shibatae (strain ATCC 51178 / DSM 5389 / JCM 8931 / NBRC 15437 / B12) TaxID=523848 RepID=A0A8F5GT88_SACSH|nr:hypothetical protein J5U23_01563 [Saccharolobus shibatae B12]